LIYTHYRRKLNFTDKRFTQRVEYIDSIRSLIAKLLKQTRSRSNQDLGDPNAKRLIEGMRDEFESHMNDDLSVGRAVDGIYRMLRELESSCFPLGPEAAGQLAAELSEIDTVLEVLPEKKNS
jgi:cysteinyl-tRNA synthetase